jgi:ribosomal protein S18 acetylase RimI-like enzyme
MTLEGGETRTVRPFVRADLAATVATLVRAFDDDPVMTWIFPDERMRRRRLPGFFAATLRGTSLRHGGTEVAVRAGPVPGGPVPGGPVLGGTVLGGAIWLPPGTWRPPLWRQLVSLPAMVFRLGSRLPVASATYGALLRLHPDRPHWYLSGIGTDPPAQGTGVGSDLMRSRLARCDAARMPAYLESSKERNVPFYERHGFGVTGELTVPRGGPTLWLMWREPQKETGR